MVQINDDNFEDLTFDSMTAVLDALAAARARSPAADRPPDQLPRGRTDEPAGDGERELRLSGALVMGKGTPAIVSVIVFVLLASWR
jgi:hypothetical protein